MKKNIKIFYATAMITLWLSLLSLSAQAAESVKNVILLIPDGTGITHTTLSRWYKGSPLALDQMVTGAVQTYSADAVIADSAPAGSAMATGHKSNTKLIGVFPKNVAVPGLKVEGTALSPAATVLEGAKRLGKSTGLIATSQIQHATPAAFSAHATNRNNFNSIAEQQVYQNLDVALGGGQASLLPQAAGGTRVDGENLINILQEKGYEVVTNADELAQAKGKKVWGAFAKDGLHQDMDRSSTKQPSLAAMTKKALQVLQTNKKGFFLMIEGSQVDWASHANDPVGVISEVLAFDEAVAAALEFAKKDGQTLVIACSDHSNGGMSIGNKFSDSNYDTMRLDTLVNPLKKAKITADQASRLIFNDRSETNIKQVLTTYGIDDPTSTEIKAIQQTKDLEALYYLLGPMFSQRTMVGWTTHGHTGEEVLLYAYGPNKPTGMIDNTDVAKKIAQSLGINLDQLTKQLYLPVEQAAQMKNIDYKLDLTDKNNPVIVLTKGKVEAKLPVDKNVMIAGNKTYPLQGLTLYINEKPYICQQALDLLEQLAK